MRLPSPRQRNLFAVAVLAVAAAGVFGAAVAQNGKSDPTTAARQAIEGGKAKNVILFLGDGMGDSEITLARNYLEGANGRLAMDSLPLTGEYTTYSVDEDGSINYVTDSAASGTGWSTGTKTYNGAISVDGQDRDLPTILEVA